MPKVITSEIKPFIGTVTLSDPLTMPQVVIIDGCLLERRDFFEQKEIDGEIGYVIKDSANWSQPDSVAVKAICECVEEWNLEKFPEKVTPETFPGSPRKASKALIDWLINEILVIYQGETDIPNE